MNVFRDQISFSVTLAVFVTLGSINTFKIFYYKILGKKIEKKYNQISKFHQIYLFIESYLLTNSAVAFVGFITETYLYGGRLLINLVSITIGYLFSYCVLQPFFYLIKEKIDSPYEYLEKRYKHGIWCRCLVAFFTAFFNFSYSTLFLWSNSTILHTLFPNVELWTCVVIMGSISGIITISGGLFQIIWLSILQYVLFLIGIITCLVISLSENQFNLSDQWKIAGDNGRLNFIDQSGGLTTRYTVWNQVFSLPIPWCTFHGIFMPSFKRYTSLNSQIKSRNFILSNIPIMWLINLLFVFGGIFSFTYFYGCDPIGTLQVKNKNQIASYWVLNVLADKLPGLSGIFLASVIAFSIVQHSNGLQLSINLLLNEAIHPIRLNIESAKLKFNLPLASFLAVLSTLYAISFQYVKNSILSLFFLFNNSINSPILGVFLQALFNPYSNTFGVCSSFLIVIAINFWLGLGAVWFSNIKSQEYPPITSNCTNNFTTQIINSDYYPKNDALYYLYSISAIWYCQFSILFIGIFGTILSILYSIIKNGRIKSETSIRKDFLYNFKRNFLYFKDTKFDVHSFINVNFKDSHL